MIQSEITNQTGKVCQYPCLKMVTNREGSTFVVLFSEHQTGMVVHDPHCVNGVGYYSVAWREEDFTPISGAIKLSNMDEV
jgi:hypothetical protein